MVNKKGIKLESYPLESFALKNSEIGAQLEQRGHCVRGNLLPQRGHSALDLNVSNRNPHPGEFKSPQDQWFPTGGAAWQYGQDASRSTVSLYVATPNFFV